MSIKIPELGFDSPGKTYNVGNVASILGAVIQVSIKSGSLQNASVGLGQYFVGNAPAAAVTLASLIFFWGGGIYDDAWKNGFPPDARKNNIGHLFSVAGATLLASGLALLSVADPIAEGSAILGGALHAGGKLGSVVDPQRDSFYKMLPLMSRVPTFAAAAYDVCSNVSKYHPGSPEAWLLSILPMTYMLCSLIWARGDIMLMPEGRAKNVLGRLFRAPQLQGSPSQP